MNTKVSDILHVNYVVVKCPLGLGQIASEIIHPDDIDVHFSGTF